MELAGLLRDMGLNGQRGTCMGCTLVGEMADRHAWRQTSQREDVEHQTRRETWMRKLYREAPNAVPPKRPDDPPSRATIEAHNLTHLPAAPWCEISVQARGQSDWHRGVRYDSEIPCVQMDFQFISGVAV